MSTLKVNTIQNTSGVTQYTAQAWVNFNGTGTVAIRASGNVSSITDNGTGDYTMNFTTAFADTNYSLTGTNGTQDTSGISYATLLSYNFTTSSCRIQLRNHQSGSAFDNPCVTTAIFR